MQNQGSLWRNFDYVMLICSLVLVVFGVLMIRSSTMGAIDPALISRVPDQIRFAIISLIVTFALALFDYRLFNGLHTWIYLLMVGLLLLVELFGVEGDGGGQQWLNIGIRIQPAEIAKLLIIITLAYYLSKNYQRMGELRTVFGSLVHVGIPTALIAIQPDLGMVTVFAVIWATMVWAAGLRIRHIIMAIMVLIVSMPLIWSVMEPYQRSRITTFIDSESDPEAYYNIRQALTAVGVGGWLGTGYANGSQTQGRFLRVRHTDFIFAVIAEEFGFVGGVTVIALLGVVILRIMRAARLAADPLGSLLCYGVAGFLFYQTFVSIGMNIGLVPVTGLTLPFISSGGTSLISSMAGIGIAQSVIMRRRRIA